jgi:hypothetical protein
MDHLHRMFRKKKEQAVGLIDFSGVAIRIAENRSQIDR